MKIPPNVQIKTRHCRQIICKSKSVLFNRNIYSDRTKIGLWILINMHMEESKIGDERSRGWTKERVRKRSKWVIKFVYSERALKFEKYPNFIWDLFQIFVGLLEIYPPSKDCQCKQKYSQLNGWNPDSEVIPLLL